MATRCLVVVSQQLLPGPSELGKERPGGLKRREWGRGVAARAAQGTWGRQLERHGVLVCLAKISLPCRLRWPLWQCGGGGVCASLSSWKETHLVVHSCRVLRSGTPLSCRSHRQLPPLLQTLLPFPGVSSSPGAELAAAASQLVREQARRPT